MNKPYWSGPGGGSASRFADDPPAGHSGPHDYRSYGGTDGYDPPTENFGALGDDYGDYPDYPADDYDDYDDYGSRPDTRWRWVAGLAAIVLLVALVAIAFATRSGDTSTSSATPSPGAVDQDAISTAPRTVIATVPPTASPPLAPPAAELPPETVVTVTPTLHQEPPVVAAPPPAEAAPAAQTITYTVTGTRQLFDLVTIFYTDEQGFPRTEINVALPWTKTVVLNPGVETKSVTATSLTGQLNCAVSDGAGTTLAAQSNNAAIATCTP